MRKMYEVAWEIHGAHALHPNYPLLPGDLLRKNEDGTFTKEAPGLCVSGFRLTEEQQNELKEITIWTDGLIYREAP